MKKSDFNFVLPEELIAQYPIEHRDNSRLLLLGRQSGQIQHRTFRDVCDLLREGDVLVLNNSKVLPARLLGKRADTGSGIEVLLLKEYGDGHWEFAAKPGKKAKVGKKLVFGENSDITITVTEVLDNGNRIGKAESREPFLEALDKVGQVPLPHYITGEQSDNDRYQTVYADTLGSAAAPTAGLHFTEELLDNLRQKGVEVAFVTLHVGLGTFRPVKEELITNHYMHSEWYTLPKETADSIVRVKKNGGRVIAVGTTSCRTLEGSFKKLGKTAQDSGETNIFIYPGYEFGVIDGLITNFHLPESTLIMLVSAFSGYDATMSAYKSAIENRYRFYSFGDAMMIV